MKKLLLISSTGGHFLEMMQLREWFMDYQYHIVTEKTKYQLNSLGVPNDKISYLISGTKKNIPLYIVKFIVNTMKSLHIFLREKPDYIVTTGAHTCVSMCYIAKLFQKKIIYIETFANIKSKTLTGRLIYPIADLFIVQWEEMLKLYPKAVYGGSIF